jgi:hypothetical protein
MEKTGGGIDLRISGASQLVTINRTGSAKGHGKERRSTIYYYRVPGGYARGKDLR